MIKNFQPEEILSKKEISREEIKVLKERIERLEAQIEKEKIPEKKEEIVKREIKTYLKELQKTPSFAPPVATRDEVKEIEKFSRGEQVGALISLAFEKGLPKAVSIAKALKNPAILDEFHDTLVDLYYQTLVEKGIIKPF